MRPMSAAALATLRGSHTFQARARVVDTYQTGTGPDGTIIDIMGGNVITDGTADIRATLDLTVDGTNLWPSRVGDLFAPYGAELFVERGIALGGGVVEWCSLGYFRIQTVGQPNPPDGPIRLDGKDRMAGIVDARLLAPLQFMPTDTYGAIMTQLVTEVYPAATIQWDDATNLATVDRSLIVEENRFAFLNDLVKSLGKIWYWDHRGILLIRNPPDPTAPVYEVNSGEGGVLVSMSRQLTRDRVYNAVVASGEAGDTDAPVRAVAVDDNPSSPTYYAGPFGPVPRFYSSPFLVDSGQAQTAAAAILTQQLGLPYSVDFATIPNPALEPYDSVRVHYTDRNAAAETHTLRSVTVPLIHSQAMTATTQEQTTILIGAL